MKILCVIRQVPDAEAKVKAANGKVNLEGATLALDGMDEYGVEQALRIGGEELVAVAIGPNSFETAIRRALAMGLTRAIHVETDELPDNIAQAKILQQIVSAEKPDLVFVGSQHADTDSQALGAALAEALNWPSIIWATQLEIADGRGTAMHDVDDGKETLEFSLPAVIGTQQGLNEPRYPTLPNIMKAKAKPLDKKTLADYSTTTSKTKITNQEIQERGRLGKILDGKDPVAAAERLVALLHNEAKVF